MSRIMIVPFEKATFKDGEVVIDDVTCTFTQNPDCTEDKDAGDVQELKVSTRNNGMARFINIKTGENGWSISDAHELDEIIQKFSEMANLKQEEQKPKWNEEDYHWEGLIRLLRGYQKTIDRSSNSVTYESVECYIEWIKSLHPSQKARKEE